MQIDSSGLLEISGRLKVAESFDQNPVKGTIRYNAAADDFEGYNGQWLSLTQNQSPAVGSIQDIDGNQYRTVKIGSQTWMRQNLRVTRFNDGTPIPEAVLNADWTSATGPAWSWPSNDAAKDLPYGKLYNGYVIDTSANGNRNVCPVNWHVADIADFETLSLTLNEPYSTLGGKLKVPSEEHWISPNSGATNETGLSFVGTGRRGEGTGNFSQLLERMYLWTSTYDQIQDAYWIVSVSNTQEQLFLGPTEELNAGYSIRCVKD